MVKTTQIFNTYEDSNDIVDEFKLQNDWLKNLDFKVHRDYTVETQNGTYMNLILSCDLLVQDIFLKKGYVIFGLNQCQIFEYVDVLRCNKCQRFGHFARDCGFVETCRKCHGNHPSNECQLPAINKCSNCLFENKKGASQNSKHRTTDERCPLRVERINALKQFYVQSNPQKSKN